MNTHSIHKASAKIALAFILTLNLPCLAAEDRNPPDAPIVVTPPKTGDDISTPAPKTGDDINTPPPPASPEAGVPISPKPADERVFCSNKSLREALSKCQEFASREGGRCEETKALTRCRFMVKYIKEMKKLKNSGPKPL